MHLDPPPCGFCRLLGFIGPEGDEARAILREIRNHQAQAISAAAGKRVVGPTPSSQQPSSSAFQSISPVASFFGSHSSSQDYHSPRSTIRKVIPFINGSTGDYISSADGFLFVLGVLGQQRRTQ